MAEGRSWKHLIIVIFQFLIKLGIGLPVAWFLIKSLDKIQGTLEFK